MKSAEPIETISKTEHPPQVDLKSGKRSRHEHELRLQLLRRQQQACEPARDGDAPLGAAPPAGAEEPLIGLDCLPPPIPIGRSSLLPATATAAGGDEEGAAGILSSAASGLDLLLDGDAPEDDTIIGSGDRAHHLALAPGLSPLTMQRRPLARDSLVLPPGPKSRAECRRRCGKAGFCDPSSDLGCGGEYCGNANAAAREAL